MGKKYIKYIGNVITGNIPIKYYGLPICICHLAFLRSVKTESKGITLQKMNTW